MAASVPEVIEVEPLRLEAPVATPPRRATDFATTAWQWRGCEIRAWTEVAPEALQSLLENPDAACSAGLAWLKAAPQQRLALLHWPQLPIDLVCCKLRDLPASRLARWWWTCWSPFRNAWRRGLEFQQLGLPTPTPLAWWHQAGDRPQQGLLTAGLADARKLDEAWREHAAAPRFRQTLAQRLGTLVRQLHAQRYDHRDLKASNILVQFQPTDFELSLIDLDGVRRWWWLPRMRREQNLSRLAAAACEFPGITPTDLARGLKAYLAGSGADWKTWWRRLRPRVERKLKLRHHTWTPRLRSLAWWAGWGLICSQIMGCHTTSKQVVGLPGRHSIRSDQLLVLSDFKLPAEHPLIADLVRLREQVADTLQLPLRSEDVVVYLFSDELTYHQYLHSKHPGLPSRRAYFIATPKELAVYTYWGDRIQEDLRHEYTHGLLHAALDYVPLWFDEGLAEYFEVAGPQPGRIQPEYAQRLSTAILNGWKPDLKRLERLEKVEQMQRADYREAWAWMHFCLHSSPETKQILLSYLHDLRKNPSPPPLSTRLSEDIPTYEVRFVNYLGTIQSQALTVNDLEPLPH